MKALASALRELLGLFVDDWRTSAGVVVWLAVAAFALPLAVAREGLRGIVLFAGIAVILVASVALGARDRPES